MNDFEMVYSYKVILMVAHSVIMRDEEEKKMNEHVLEYGMNTLHELVLKYD